MIRACFVLGPATVRVACTDAAQRRSLAACWAQLFRTDPDCTEPSDQAVDLLLTGDRSLAHAYAADVAGECAASQTGGVCLRHGRTGIWISCGDSHVRVQIATAHAEGCLAQEFWTYSLVEQREFFLRIFFLLLRGHGIHLLHANALVAPPGDAQAGVLLVGDCGAGKTTLSLSLLRAGWRYVADDSVLLAPAARGGVWAYPVRRGLACTPESAALWPDPGAGGPALNRSKTLVQPERSEPELYRSSCSPALLLFPHVAAVATTRLAALDTTESFLHLLAQPRAGILAEPGTAPAVLSLLQRLVAQCSGYTAALGEDVFRDPAQVARLLEAALPGPAQPR